jgi:hypothetical protein
MMYVVCIIIILAAFGYIHYWLVREQAFVLVEEIKTSFGDVLEPQPTLYLVPTPKCQAQLETLQK